MSVLSLARFKRCSKCRCWKPVSLTFWSRSKAKRYGVHSICRICNTLYLRDDYAKNRAARLAQQKEYRQRTHEKKRVYLALWVASNREKARIGKRAYKARKKGADGEHTADEILWMLEDQNGLCAYCERELNGAYHADHMIPLSRGGSNEATNLAIVCPTCNLSKKAMTVEEFMERT